MVGGGPAAMEQNGLTLSGDASNARRKMFAELGGSEDKTPKLVSDAEFLAVVKRRRRRRNPGLHTQCQTYQ